jgi:hypothetical protein
LQLFCFQVYCFCFLFYLLYYFIMKKKFLLSKTNHWQTTTETIYDYDFTSAINWLWSKIRKPINFDLLFHHYIGRDEFLPAWLSQEEIFDCIREEFEGRALRNLRNGDSYDFLDYDRTEYQIEEIKES